MFSAAVIALVSNEKLDDRGDHEPKAGKYGCIHDKCAGKSARRSPNRVSNRKGKSTDEDEALKDDGYQWVVECADDGSEN